MKNSIENMENSNIDFWGHWDSNEFMYSMTADDVDGGILSFEATHPKWSFAKLNEATNILFNINLKLVVSFSNLVFNGRSLSFSFIKIG